MYFDSCTFLKCLSRGLIATSFPPPFPVSSKARRNRASFSRDFADITETTIRRVPEVIIVKLPELNFSEVVYNAGDVILQQGEFGDNMFWIEEGSSCAFLRPYQRKPVMVRNDQHSQLSFLRLRGTSTTVSGTVKQSQWCSKLTVQASVRCSSTASESQVLHKRRDTQRTDRHAAANKSQS